MARVLVVDSNKKDRDWLCELFGGAGYEAAATDLGEKSLKELSRGGFELVVTDWLLPDMTGLDLIARIRNSRDTADMRIVLVSTRNEASDIAMALDSGADDFVAKPAHPVELLARANAALRRPALPAANGCVITGPIRLDSVSHTVTANGGELSLAPVEFRLLAFFMRNGSRVLSRPLLLEQVWNRRAGIGERTVDVHVRRLRALLEPHGCADMIQTVRGFGYRFG